MKGMLFLIFLMVTITTSLQFGRKKFIILPGEPPAMAKSQHILIGAELDRINHSVAPMEKVWFTWLRVGS